MSNFDKNDYERRDRRPQDRPRTDYRRDNNDYRRDEHHQTQPQQQSSNNYSTNASYRANDRYVPPPLGAGSPRDSYHPPRGDSSRDAHHPPRGDSSRDAYHPPDRTRREREPRNNNTNHQSYERRKRARSRSRSPPPPLLSAAAAPPLIPALLTKKVVPTRQTESRDPRKILSFKEFLLQQPDNINPNAANRMYQDYRRNQEQQGELRNWFEYSKEKDWMQLLYNPLRQKLNIEQNRR
jgi:hypothetical protein